MTIKSSWTGRIILGLCCLAWSGGNVPAADEAKSIHHKFIAIDESRHQAVYVDESDPSKNWKLDFPRPYRDYQLIGQNRLLMSTGSGYREYDLATRQMLKEFTDKQLGGSDSVRRLPDGRTIVGCNQQKMIVFYELDPQDKIVQKAEFAGKSTLRLARLTPRGTFLFGANSNHVIEGDMKGTVIRDITLEKEKAGHIYQILEKPDGHLLVGSGYGQLQLELDKDGKEVKCFGGKPGPAGLGFHFFAGFQVLKNGHIVQVNWTGHGPQDSTKGVQLVEFDADGKIVWQWHNPEMVGSLHGVIVMDDLDPAVLNTDCSSVLGPATK